MANEIRNRWAFLVGVNHYRESSRFKRLHHCINDVLELKDLLEDIGFSTAICLHDDLDRDDERFPDTAINVKAELRKLRDKIGPDDLLLVYFACHGTRSLLADDTRPYLILRDTRSTMPETALALADLKDEMQHIQAERQVLILDACHMGMGKDDRGDGTEAARQFIRNVHELATGFTLLTPSTAQQTTKESDDLQHGVFSHFVLAGLRGEGEALVSATEPNRGFVTPDSLKKYVFNQMLIWSAQQGYEQMPQGQAEGDLGDFMLVDYRQQKLPEVPAYSQDVAVRLGKPRSAEAGTREMLAEDETPKPGVSINWDKPQNRKALKDALAKVYPSVPELEIFVDDELGKNLEDITDEGSLKKDIHKLVKWARAKGRIAFLYQSFCDCNEGNPSMTELNQQLS